MFKFELTDESSVMMIFKFDLKIFPSRNSVGMSFSPILTDIKFIYICQIFGHHSKQNYETVQPYSIKSEHFFNLYLRTMFE